MSEEWIELIHNEKIANISIPAAEFNFRTIVVSKISHWNSLYEFAYYFLILVQEQSPHPMHFVLQQLPTVRCF